MSDDPTNGEDAIPPGIRRDGRRYAEGNTREDGDYRVGKNRPPEHSRFRAGDGRRRGRRPKGQRNFDKDWEDELGRTVHLTRDGRKMSVSAHRAQVMTALSLAAKGRERSQELVIRKPAELADRKRSVQSQGDDALIAEWLAQHALPTGPADEPMIIGDDDPDAPDQPAAGAADDENPDNLMESDDDDPE